MSDHPAMLVIAGQAFEIVDAAFGCHLGLRAGGWRPCLSLDVRARAGWREARILTPSFAVEFPALDVLEGVALDVPAPVDLPGLPTWPAFVLHIHDDQEIRRPRLSFGHFDGDRLPACLTGFVDVEDDDGNVAHDAALALSAPLRFDGVVVDEGWTHKAEERLAQFFDRASFDAPVKRPDGAHVFRRKLGP